MALVTLERRERMHIERVHDDIPFAPGFRGPGGEDGGGVDKVRTIVLSAHYGHVTTVYLGLD